MFAIVTTAGSVDAHADFCLTCIPMHLLARIEHNFPPDYADALGAVPHGKLFKIGLQMKQRFWESEGIYGGISWTPAGHHAAVVSGPWHPSPERCDARRIHVQRRSCREIRRNCRPRNELHWRSSKARRSILATVAMSKAASASPGIA